MNINRVLARSACKPGLAAALLLLAAALPARAADTEILHYTARLHGLRLLDVTLCLRLDAATYFAGIQARTVGMAEMLVHGRADGHVSGAVEGQTLKPRDYVEHSKLSGEAYTIAIGYPNGDPVLKTAIPPQEKYRLPVPPEDLSGAVDGLTAVALESLQATRTGTCEGGALVYDGRQLRRATTHPAGREILNPGSNSMFAGPALRCNTESQMLAGFLKSRGIKPQQKPRYSSAWLAPVLPGGPDVPVDVPVKVTFDADFLGDIIVDLDAASKTQGPACPSAP